jgi:hypothetical protein
MIIIATTASTANEIAAAAQQVQPHNPSRPSAATPPTVMGSPIAQAPTPIDAIHRNQVVRRILMLTDRRSIATVKSTNGNTADKTPHVAAFTPLTVRGAELHSLVPVRGWAA